MIRHILKLVWNRKRANALVAIEIGIAFIVLFAVTAVAVYAFSNSRQPLGFDYSRVWVIRIDWNVGGDDHWTPETAAATQRVVRAVRELPEVEAVAGAAIVPYTTNRSISSYDLHGHSFRFDRNEVTDDFKDVMGLTLVSGRWFSAEDRGAAFVPVILNARLARSIFGTEDAVGKNIAEGKDEPTERVIGVISDFRVNGEFAGVGNYAFFRADLDSTESRPPGNLVIRLRPGTPRSFEESLLATLQGVEKNFSYQLQPASEMRETALSATRAMLIAIGLVALFLILMVGLGLTGVLWQNVTQRTREIGLRRAKGAAAVDIYAQILGELFVITTLGLALGVAVAIQVPMLGLFDSVSGGVYAASFAISLATMYLLTALCGLYPSRLAARVEPVEALRYE